MEASPPSPPSGPPLAAGGLDRFCEQLQELTQRCNAAQRENDKLRDWLNWNSLDLANSRNQIGDMKKEIDHLKRWNWAHMEEATAGVRSSSSNDSSNTWVWNGSNSWWTAGSGWDGSWWKDHSNVPWHVSK